MREYTFLAKDNYGNTIRDETYALDEASAVRRLQERQLTVVRIDLVKPLSLWHRLFEPVKPEVLVMVFRQLASMLGAGIPLIRSLHALAKDEGLPPRFLKALQRVAADVTTGYSLSQAMRLFPEFFSAFMTGSIQIGEISGRLPDTVNNCANHLEKEYRYNLKLRQALLYPCVLLISLGLLMAFCFTYMIPMFLDLFGDVQIELPWPTKVLMACSDVLTSYGAIAFFTLIGPAIVGLWLLVRWIKTKPGRWRCENALLHIPWYGRQARLRMQSRYFRSLHTLMRSAIPLSTSLQVLSTSLEHEILRATANLQLATIRQGGSLTTGLRRSGIFQPLALELIKVGEETGEVTSILERLANYLDDEMTQGLELMSKLIEPVVLAILGVGVAFVLLAAFMPIYALAQSF